MSEMRVQHVLEKMVPFTQYLVLTQSPASLTGVALRTKKQGWHGSPQVWVCSILTLLFSLPHQ